MFEKLYRFLGKLSKIELINVWTRHCERRLIKLQFFGAHPYCAHPYSYSNWDIHMNSHTHNRQFSLTFTARSKTTRTLCLTTKTQFSQYGCVSAYVVDIVRTWMVHIKAIQLHEFIESFVSFRIRFCIDAISRELKHSCFTKVDQNVRKRSVYTTPFTAIIRSLSVEKIKKNWTFTFETTQYDFLPLRKWNFCCIFTKMYNLSILNEMFVVRIVLKILNF